MAYNAIGGFPSQQLPFSRKGKAWRKAVIDFADSHSLMHYSLTRKSVKEMRINYDLVDGIIHMDDMKALVNPYNIDASFIPNAIQHYPIINSKLRVLQGEEGKRLFDYRAVITNPNAISEIEENKNKVINSKLQQMISDMSQSPEEFQKELEQLDYYAKYTYQDKREVRANQLLNHYIKELNIQNEFNKGFMDACTSAEEAYLFDIVGGEPYFERINPINMRVLMSTFSDKIEDADMIILENYWTKGKVLDFYWDQLTKKEISKIETMGNSTGTYTDDMGNIDARYNSVIGEKTFAIDLNNMTAGELIAGPKGLFDDDTGECSTPYDMNGNIRVLRVFWKSLRMIKKVKSYDPETGEEQFNFYPETYHCHPELGEEEDTYWINEAWEGTKIGEDIYVNMRPKPIQYNKLSNPSKCHLGIIGSIYTNGQNKPYSLVDLMKPYAYQYDINHDKLNKLLAKNQGKIIRFDFAKVPNKWDVDKWLYYLNVNGIAVEDSFNEGISGRSTGVLAGAMNNATSGVIDASLGNEIQEYISLLEWLSNKTGELAGITKQREGQISNRETVGGVERATLQSSHSTEWLFSNHESVKQRCLECLLETAKIALKGRKKKFSYILSDGSEQLVEIDGDEFAECDYGIVVSNDSNVQELNQKLDLLAQAGLQTQTLGFSTIMKLYSSMSLAEKQRMIELDEQKMQQLKQEEQQRELQQRQAEMQQQAQIEQAKLEREYQMHVEDNETKILIAQINSRAEEIRMSIMNHDNDELNVIEREKLAEQARQFDAKLKQDAEKLSIDRQKQKDDARLKEKQINKMSTKTSGSNK